MDQNLSPLMGAMTSALARRDAHTPQDDAADEFMRHIQGPPNDLTSPEAQPWIQAMRKEPEFDHTAFTSSSTADGADDTDVFSNTKPSGSNHPRDPRNLRSASSTADGADITDGSGTTTISTSPPITENGQPKTESDSVERRSLEQLGKDAGRIGFKKYLIECQQNDVQQATQTAADSWARLLKGGIPGTKIADAVADHQYNALDVLSRQADVDWSQHELAQAQAKHYSHQAWHEATFPKPAPAPPVQDVPPNPAIVQLDPGEGDRTVGTSDPASEQSAMQETDVGGMPQANDGISTALAVRQSPITQEKRDATQLGQDNPALLSNSSGGLQAASVMRGNAISQQRPDFIHRVISAIEGIFHSSHAGRGQPSGATAAGQPQNPEDPARRRADMARRIVNSEARRDKNGKLRVYSLPENDGGGAYEVAGINEKYDTDEAARLKSLIESGKADIAEQEAAEYIAKHTDAVAGWSHNRGVEFYLRDSCFNRGLGGAAKILQMALGEKADGKIGPKTMAALAEAEKNPGKLLQDLRRAREEYEDVVAPGRPNLRQGLINRWNSALDFAESLNRP